MLDSPPAPPAAPTVQSRFTIAVRPDIARVSVALTGELDLESAGQLRQEIDSLRDAGFDDIAVDLAGVTFLDSTGLQTLLFYAHRARADELRFRLTATSASVKRLFELTATHDALEFGDRPAG